MNRASTRLVDAGWDRERTAPARASMLHISIDFGGLGCILRLRNDARLMVSAQTFGKSARGEAPEI